MNLEFKSILTASTTLLIIGCGGGGGGGSSDTTAPSFTSANNKSVSENQKSTLTVQAEDNSTVAYSISGGADSNRFSIHDTTGVMTFKNVPDYETPVDSDGDNAYEVTVTAKDTSSNTATQDITITVTDMDESPSADTDNDYIPDNIEVLLGTDSNDQDTNNDGTEDGLDTTGAHGDTFFDMQWHIHSQDIAVNESGLNPIVGNDLHLLEVYSSYMGYNHGNNIIIQVVDTGVDADHEDLTNNMDMSRSYDGASVGDPSPNTTNGGYTHGTMVAGIIAAEAFNGKGVRGIIPFAKIAGSNWLETQTNPGLEKAWLTGAGANEISVSSNSWGSYYDTDTVYEEIMAQGTSTLRNGKGRIYVFAAGNDRGIKGDANLQYALTNRFSIAVAALKHDNTHASYSTPGSNILVSGYGGEFYQDAPTIGTTTVMGTSNNTGDSTYTDNDESNDQTTWSADTHKNYTFGMNGTSAAAPTVAAAIGLVLEACPQLTWRDIKYLIAQHATKIDAGNSSWIQNHAGLWYSTDYGFGLIDTKSMIDACTAGYSLLPHEKSKTVAKTFNTSIPDNNTARSFNINMTDSMTLEWAEITIDNDSAYASDYKIELTSPSGTKTTLINEETPIEAQDGNGQTIRLIPTVNWMDGGFRFATAAMIGENSNGTWKISIRDALAGDVGTLKSITLKVYGH